MKKSKTTIEALISQAKEQGMNIKATKRKDGGYIVRAIDGTKYTGKEGNKALRNIMGTSLSQAQIEQRRANRVEIEQLKKLEPFKNTYSDKLLKEAAKTKEFVEKSLAAQGLNGSWNPFKSIEYYKSKGYDEERVAEMISNIRTKAAGFAYADNVEAFIMSAWQLPLFQGDNGAIRYYKLKYLSAMQQMRITDLNILLEELYKVKNDTMDYSEFEYDVDEILNKYNLSNDPEWYRERDIG